MQESSASQSHRVRIFAPPDEASGEWHAVVEQWPFIAATASSRAAVLVDIESKLQQALRTSEIITLQTPQATYATLPANPTPEEVKAYLHARGFTAYGAFADDPEALVLFDEIEQQRDALTLEDVLRNTIAEKAAA